MKWILYSNKHTYIHYTVNKCGVIIKKKIGDAYEGMVWGGEVR
jgi:hypothetical protein